MKWEKGGDAKKKINFYCSGSFLIVLSDSDVILSKIMPKRIEHIDFQLIPTILGHFRLFDARLLSSTNDKNVYFSLPQVAYLRLVAGVQHLRSFHHRSPSS